MRKDVFLVGARLLGIWQLLGGLGSLVWIIIVGLGYLHPQSYSQEYNSVNFIIHLATGLYLVFKTEHLFQLLDRLKTDEDENGEKTDDATGHTNG